jgi:phosphoribosylanthranilate isomerase
MPRVKFCGIMRSVDAQHAAELGAAAIGLIFVSGTPRCLTSPQARDVASGLPADVWKVGVFQQPTIAELERHIAEVPLDAVQLHGAESPAFCAAVQRLCSLVIKAIRFDRIPTTEAVQPYLEVPELRILIDGRFGSGSLDWSAARELIVAAGRPVALAGGLDPTNVSRAIAEAEPAAVDVSRGVERAGEPGVKDHALMAAFVESVRRAGDVMPSPHLGPGPTGRVGSFWPGCPGLKVGT